MRRLASIEHPEEKEHFDSLNLELSSDTFLFKPLKNENWTVKASLQKRHLIAIKVAPNGTAQIAGVIEKHHAFRELFDFIPEDGDRLPDFTPENFNEILAKMTEESVDLSSIVIAPSGGFSYANLPFAQRELKTSVRTSSRANNPAPIERSWNISFFDEEIPSGPSAEVVNRVKNIPASHIEQVREVFSSRPILSKAYLESKITDPSIISNLKLILPTVAYHWKNGPWHLLWTCYGIDPRANSQFKHLQSIELRNKMFAKELSRGRITLASKQKQPSIATVSSGNNFCFDGQELTLNYFTYQLCDLTYPPLAQIVNNPGQVKTYLTERDGWFVEGTLKKLRDLMKVRWFELIKSSDLSALPQHKLEEILQVIAPRTGKLALSGTINQIISQIEEVDEEEEEESDYEIFDE